MKYLSKFEENISDMGGIELFKEEEPCSAKKLASCWAEKERKRK